MIRHHFGIHLGSSLLLIVPYRCSPTFLGILVRQQVAQMTVFLYLLRACSTLLAVQRRIRYAFWAHVHSWASYVADWTAPAQDLIFEDAHLFEDFETLLWHMLAGLVVCSFAAGWILGSRRVATARGLPRDVATTSVATSSHPRVQTPPAALHTLPALQVPLAPCTRRPLRRADANPVSPLPRRNLENEFPVGVLGSPRFAAPSAVGGCRPH